MKQITKTILVEQNLLAEMNDHLESNDFIESYGDNELLWIGTAKFTEDIEADIKICNGDGPYVDPVLFHNNNEVLSIEVTDRLDGEYVFEYKGTKYIVLVDVKNE